MDLEKVILGCGLVNPKIIKDLNIDKNFFKDQTQRLIFRELQAGNVDVNVIANKIKKPGIYGYLSDLMAGITGKEDVKKYVIEIKKKRQLVEICKEIEKEAKAGELDPEIIRPMWDSYEKLSIEPDDAKTINLNNVIPKLTNWFWYNRIPQGKLSLIIGDPDAGKTTLSLWIASRITRGDPWPDIPNISNSKGSVILVSSGEDGIDDVLRVRADDMKADVKKITVMQPVNFDMNEIIKSLRYHIKNNEDVKLIILDPITSFMGNIEGNKETSVRSALAPLSVLADQLNITILGTLNLNKDQAKKALYRALGSIAFIAVARSVWLVQKDEDDPERERRFFTPLKANLSKNPSTLAFKIDGPLGHPRIEFESEPVDRTADELLADEEAQERISALEEAKNFLREALKNGRIPSKDLEDQAKELKIAERTLKRAKAKLRIKSYKGKNKWWVELL